MSHAHTSPGPARPQPTTPLAQYLSARPPGMSTDGRYLVLPRIVLDQLPPAAQQELVQLLTAVHTLGSRFWPASYRVGAIRWEPLGQLAEAELRELGVVAELDLDGELVHRSATTGQQLTGDDLERPAPVACPDPFYAHVDPSRRQQP